MTFTAPIALLALLSIPAIVALHLFRNRLPERVVSALFLFPATPVLADGGRNRTRLLRSPSLWLECLAALLLSLWLAGMTIGGLRPRHVVLVLDDSASMSADGTRERVLITLQRLLTDLDADDEVTVLRTGEPAEVLLGPRGSAGDLAVAVARWRPSAPRHARQPALDLARDLAGHSGEVVLCTDEAPGSAVDDVRVIAHGERRANAALTSVQRVRDRDRDRLLVAVTAFGEVGDAEVTVHDGERELLRLPLSLPADGSDLQFGVQLPPGAGDLLRVELSPDALAIDDVAWVAFESVRSPRVCDRLGFEQRRLLRLEEVFAALEDWQAERDPSRAQIILSTEPGPLAAGQLELVIAASAGEPVAHRSPFVVDRSHPLLAGVALAGVAWRSGSGDLPGQVLVADGEKVLISEQWPAAGRRLWLDVDPTAGNLVRAPDWPILFANVLAVGREQAPGCRAQVVRVGEPIVYRHDGPTASLVVLDPDGRRLSASDAGGAVSCRAERPGIHRVQAGDGRVLARVAARFVDLHESDLRRAASFDRPPTVQSGVEQQERLDAAPMRRWLAVLLLLAVLLDWCWLHRRGS